MRAHSTGRARGVQERNRAISSGATTRLVADGTRGAGKSSYLHPHARPEARIRGQRTATVRRRRNALFAFDVEVAKAGLEGHVEVFKEPLVSKKNHRERFNCLCNDDLGVPGVVCSNQHKLEIHSVADIFRTSKSGKSHGWRAAPLDPKWVGIFRSYERPLGSGVE